VFDWSLYLSEKHIGMTNVKFYVLPILYLCILLFISERTETSAPIQHKLLGFYNREEKCLLRSNNWVFK